MSTVQFLRVKLVGKDNHEPQNGTRKALDLGSERGDLHEHEIFEDLITSKVENVLQQLRINKALLRELGTSLGHKLQGSESFHNQMPTNEKWQMEMSSIFLPLLNISQMLNEFEGIVCQKFEMMAKLLVPQPISPFLTLSMPRLNPCRALGLLLLALALLFFYAYGGEEVIKKEKEKEKETCDHNKGKELKRLRGNHA
ncbi:unnamed protein product [Lupinus luteus]|uniref:Uncharacterized protein n=1 Tax=Lupinus luteus TaxID=3873 RepID=A0AAV1XB20_LUPLU